MLRRQVDASSSAADRLLPGLTIKLDDLGKPVRTERADRLALRVIFGIVYLAFAAVLVMVAAGADHTGDQPGFIAVMAPIAICVGFVGSRLAVIGDQSLARSKVSLVAAVLMIVVGVSFSVAIGFSVLPFNLKALVGIAFLTIGGYWLLRSALRRKDVTRALGLGGADRANRRRRRAVGQSPSTRPGVTKGTSGRIRTPSEAAARRRTVGA